MSARDTIRVERPAARRLVQVLCGLVLYGVSMAMIVNASGNGRVTIGEKSPAVIISPLRNFSSASGARTKPITKGPSGMPARSIR